MFISAYSINSQEVFQGCILTPLILPWNVVQDPEMCFLFCFGRIPKDVVFGVVVFLQEGGEVFNVVQIIGAGFPAGEGKVKVTLWG